MNECRTRSCDDNNDDDNDDDDDDDDSDDDDDDDDDTGSCSAISHLRLRYVSSLVLIIQ